MNCARELSRTGRTVLLLDKGTVLGDKLCGGGLTLKDMEILPLPDSVFEHKITRAVLYSKRNSLVTNFPDAFLFTVNRMELAAWQKGLLESTGVKVRLNSHVTSIEENKLVLRDGREYGFRYLVGADGYFSVVRKYLQLPVKKRLIGFQYTLKKPGVEPELRIYLDSGRFRSWYAWIFPHRDSISVGCCCDPHLTDHNRMQRKFREWLERMNIDTGDARLESYPISYDYRGIRFGNIFLAGEAAGLPSGLTGEGIYQSLASGQEIARMILDPDYHSLTMKEVLKYNRILSRIYLVLRRAGPLRGVLHELFVCLMKNKHIQARVNANFS